MRKFQKKKKTGLKTLVGEIKNAMESLTSRIIAADTRIGQLENELYTREEIGKVLNINNMFLVYKTINKSEPNI